MKFRGNILEVHNLTLSAVNDAKNPVRLIDGLSFTLRSGEILGLIGNSGAGKTMTALAISGLLSDSIRVDGGNVFLEGDDLLCKSAPERRKLLGEKIGLVFQDPASSLDPLQTVEANLSEIFRIRKNLGPDAPDRSEIKEKIYEMLRIVGFEDPEEIAGRYPHRLSGGQRQRVLIAGAALMRPSLLIADEPTSSLDTVTSMSILQLMHEMCSELGISILFISHNLNAVKSFCDRVMVMKEGKIIDSDVAEDILGNPRSAYTAELLRLSRLDPDAGEFKPEPVGKDALKVLDVRNVTAGYRSAPVIKGIDLDVKKGECAGLIGTSGCGKTTLIKTILGLIKPSDGAVDIDGRVACVFQDPVSSLNPAHTIKWHLKEALRSSGRKLSKIDETSCFTEVLEDVGLSGKHLGRYPHQLSGGQRQMAAIAMCLIGEPSIIIADEPFSALDAASQASVLRLLADINRKRGTALLIVSHNLRVIRAMCSRVYVMDSGIIAEEGDCAGILTSPASEAASRLIQAELYGT